MRAYIQHLATSFILLFGTESMQLDEVWEGG